MKSNNRSRSNSRTRLIDTEYGAINIPINPHSEQHKSSGQFVKSAIYGGLDGVASIFVSIAAVAGQKDVGVGLALVFGLAKLFAGGLSMGIGDWLATSAEVDLARTEKAREAWEFDNFPEGEIEEMVEIYVKKGLSPEAAKRIMEILSKYPQAFIDIMLAEEIGISSDIFNQKPWKHGLVNFTSFMIWGSIPLIVYLVFVAIKSQLDHNVIFGICAGVSILTLFIMGLIKGKLTDSNLFLSALLTVFCGAVSAGIGYGTVIGLEKWTGVRAD
eukprot:TRINITY_DN4090_c0_g1_i1.p1 TRINITY_DN4090_c0_g1~~TRINITY_DN4090_c0_g1_i1.p1  ORF type:complete len:272 (-),score=81.96 TRINITY_DN4090_c0_g1_i1:185-1000(-)